MPLISSTIPQREVKVRRPIVKIIILAVLGVASSFFFAYFLKLFIFSGGPNNALKFSLIALAFLVFFLFNVLFIKEMWIVSLIVFLEVLAMLGAFYDRLSLMLAIGCLVLYFLLTWADMSGRREISSLLNIRFGRISRATLSKTILALVLFGSFAYYLRVETLSSNGKEFFISKPSFEKIIYPMAPFAKAFIPGFDPGMSVDGFAKYLAQMQIRGDFQFQALAPAEQKSFLEKTVSDLEKQFAGTVGSSFNAKDTLSEAIYKLTVNKYDGLPEGVKTVSPALVAIVVFLSIMVFAWLIRMAAVILAWLIFQILLATGFVYTTFESRSQETISLT